MQCDVSDLISSDWECVLICLVMMFNFCFFFQAEDGIRDLVRSRGLGDVYKRQLIILIFFLHTKIFHIF